MEGPKEVRVRETSLIWGHCPGQRQESHGGQNHGKLKYFRPELEVQAIMRRKPNKQNEGNGKEPRT